MMDWSGMPQNTDNAAWERPGFSMRQWCPSTMSPAEPSQCKSCGAILKSALEAKDLEL